jgi:hypothetical protein
MAITGYTCPPWMPTAGRQNPIAYCLAGGLPEGCPHPCVSPPLLAAIYQAEVSNHHVGSYISATMLSMSGCPRQTVLERGLPGRPPDPWYETPIKRWWPFRGVLAHALVENAGDLVTPMGWLQELRMRVPLQYPELPQPAFDAQGVWTGDFVAGEHLVITLGGTTDAYNPRIRTIHDFKSQADTKVEMMARKGTCDPKHAEQLNVYRFLVSRTPIDAALAAKCRVAGFDPTGHDYLPAPESLVIQGFSMMALARTGSAVELKVKPDGVKWARKETFEIAPVPVWPLDEIEAWIRPRALAWYRWLVLGQPTPIVDEADKWLCRGCAFNGELVEGGVCFPERERYQQQRAADVAAQPPSAELE